MLNHLYTSMHMQNHKGCRHMPAKESGLTNKTTVAPSGVTELAACERTYAPCIAGGTGGEAGAGGAAGSWTAGAVRVGSSLAAGADVATAGRDEPVLRRPVPSSTSREIFSPGRSGRFGTPSITTSSSSSAAGGVTVGADHLRDKPRGSARGQERGRRRRPVG